MKNAAVVCEFDPLHRGHEYLIRRARESGAERIICIMSGAVCQRGEPALFSAHARARAAVSAGADLVLELPYPYSGASAEHFAFGAISIVCGIVGVDSLFFGCESKDGGALVTCADRLLSREFDEEYKKTMKSSPELSAAASMERAYAALYGDGALLRGANNVLAIEYIKAARRLGADLCFFPVHRVGADHSSTEEYCGYCSASYIRTRIKDDSPISHLLSPASAEIFEEELEKGSFSSGFDALGDALLLHFRTLDPKTAATAELGGGLAERIVNAAIACADAAEFFSSLRTKRYTDARLRRAMLFSLCGVTAADLITPPTYTTLLAATDAGLAFLSEHKKTRGLFVASNPSALGKLGGEHQRQKLLRLRAQGLREAVCKSPRAPIEVLSSPPFILRKEN